MASKATPSCSSLKTLNGMFEMPRMTHRRDFLRENKLNLKELQRNTTHKLQDKQEQEKRQQFQMQNHKNQREKYVARRSMSQQRLGTQIPKESDQKLHSSQMPTRRSLNPQGDTPKREKGNTDAYNQCCHNCHCHTLPPQSNGKNDLASNACAASIISKTESCDKEIQTDDIIDEEFLYEALRKCSSIDLRRMANNEPRYRGNYINQEQDYNADRMSQLDYNNYNRNINKAHYDDEDAKSQINYLQHETKSHHSFNNDDAKSHHSYRSSQHSFQQMEKRSLHNMKAADNVSQCSVRTRYSQMQPHNQLHNSSRMYNHHHVQEEDDPDQLDQGMQNMNIARNEAIEPEINNSARGHPMNKQKPTGTVHKMGNRDDIRLPRYLEREKREKEIERQKELSRDPNCPFGCYLLTESDRLSHLKKTQKKMATLIHELNHMPMTMDTLRLRKRRVDIETQLTQLESDVRLYSKPKVYLPITNEQA